MGLSPGQATIIELVPTVRLLALPAGTTNINVFAQVGLGYFFINQEARIKASYLGVTYQESIEESENKLGVTLGGGIILGRKGGFCLEIFPLYCIVFTDDEHLNKKLAAWERFYNLNRPH